MSISIKLDAPALRALIANDAAFELELQRAVIAEVVRNLVMPKIVEEFSKITGGMVGEIVVQMKEDQQLQADVAHQLQNVLTRGTYGATRTLTPAMQERVDAAILDRINELGKEQLPNLLKAQQDVVSVLKSYLDERNPGAIKNAIDAYDKRQVEAEVERRLNAIREAI